MQVLRLVECGVFVCIRIYVLVCVCALAVLVLVVAGLCVVDCVYVYKYY